MSAALKPTLLIIDDLPMVREFYRDLAQEEGWAVLEAYDAETFEAVLGKHYDAIILDLAMPSITGIEVMEALAARKDQSPIVISSGQGEKFIDMSMRLGRDLGLNMATRLTKPVDVSRLEQTLSFLEKTITASASQMAPPSKGDATAAA